MSHRKSGKKSPEPERILEVLKLQAASPRRLLRDLGLASQQRAELVKVLRALAAAGKVVRLRGGAFGLPRSTIVLTGRLVQKQPGYAFVAFDAENEPDVYVPGRALGDAMPDDKVEIRLIPGAQPGRGQRQKRQGEVVRVVARAREQVVGSIRQAGKRFLIQPDGMHGLYDFWVPKNKEQEAKAGQKVVAKILAWPKPDWPGEAEVVEVLGVETDPGVGITALVKRYGLPDTFSREALEQARAIAQEPDSSQYAQRRDLRGQVILTIDGADARDFDDAVDCRIRPGGGWRLGVHIADVSHYLHPGTRLDLEARERGTSVYLPDRVLHMLPEPLSCGVCSLLPQQDRYAVSALMDVEPDGRISKAEFFRSVIRSHARLTYDWVQAILTQGDMDNPAAPFAEELKTLQQVAQALRARRRQRGSLDFDLPDPRVVLGPDGRVQTIEKRVQLESHRLIEDCMIAANESVAEYLRRCDRPSLYRVHDAPGGEKLIEFKEFLAAYGYTLEIGKPSEASKAFQRLTRQWDGKPEAQLLNMTLLRAMKLAVYAPKNIGHFGLASACYTHFTSPIRRYPDLIVHRMLTEQLEQGSSTGERRNELQARMQEWGVHLSERERRAEKAEREAVALKQLEFISGHVGGTFQGIITTVAAFGFFVELQEHFVEGLVRVAELTDDYYYFEETRRTLQGTNTGRIFYTGLPVQVRVERVDPMEARAVFSLQDEKPKSRPGPRRNPPRLVARKGRRR